MPAGRPTEYREEYAECLDTLIAKGATDAQIADLLKVHVSTLYVWRKKHPEFDEALKSAKEQADQRVVQALFDKATTGADTTAQIFWLKNRQSAEWREKSEVAVTGDIAGIIAARRKRAAPSTDDK
jgi:hypothetical protein